MNKTRRTLIISSCIMALAFVVAVVSISAAWFGDMRKAQQGGFIISSDKLQDSATIDINSAKGMTGETIYPAIAESGYFLKNAATAPTGAVLKGSSLPTGVTEAARVATIYLPITVIGTADSDYDTENRKSLDLKVLSANVDSTWADIDNVENIDFLKEFNVEMELVNAKFDADGNIDSEQTVPLETADSYTQLSGGDIFYDNYGYDLYMLVQPGITYYVKVQIYFNKIDEECNPHLLGTTIKFNFKLNVLSDGSYIRDGKYIQAGGESND